MDGYYRGRAPPLRCNSGGVLLEAELMAVKLLAGTKRGVHVFRADDFGAAVGKFRARLPRRAEQKHAAGPSKASAWR